MPFTQFCYVRRLVFDQSSPIHPVCESKASCLSVSNKGMEMLVSNIGYHKTSLQEFKINLAETMFYHFTMTPCMGNSMSKVREKRSTSKSGFFFNEIWKIIGQIDDFDRFLNNFCNLAVFLAKNQKYPKITVLKKVKIEKKKKKNWRLKNLCQILYIIFL